MGSNPPTVVVNQGAEVAIGFSKNILCDDANEWTERFYTYMLNGYTVEYAVNELSTEFSESSGLRSAVICGNKHYRLV